MNPQRLDTLVGKILRIVPDGAHVDEHREREQAVRIPNDNPFSEVEGARKEIWAYGLRNPHRLIWASDPGRSTAPQLLAFNIGLVTWETVVIIRKGANYGYPLREGTNDVVDERDRPDTRRRHDSDSISDTVARGTVKPTYPVFQYRHTAAEGGDAIANGFVYRGKLVPALRDKLVFGDITTGRGAPSLPRCSRPTMVTR